MITLHGFGSAWGMADLSNFVTKVDCYLRMAGIPFTRDPSGPASWRSFKHVAMSPKYKLPYIDDNGIRVADSGFIIEYLKHTYGDALGDGALDREQRAVAHSMRRMLEESLYWGFVYTMWQQDDGWELYLDLLQAYTPDEVAEIANARQLVRSQLHMQGMGRHSPDEVAALGNADLTAISGFLGDKPFLMGDRPKSIDASAYAMLGRLMWAPLDSTLRRHAMATPNLDPYCRRMHALYYADSTFAGPPPSIET